MRSDDGLGAVIQQFARNAAEVRERRPVARPERHEIHRPDQPDEAVARVPQRHVKAVERKLQPRRGPDRRLVRPIDLRLMTRGGLKALLRPGRHALIDGAGAFDVATYGLVGASEAVVAHEVLMDPGRQQPRALGQPLIDHRLERIELGRCALAPVDRLGVLGQIALDRPPIAADRPADLRVRVPLPVQGLDVHEVLLADQHTLPRLA